jgi:dolichyl-diphosphooligosaccharide---protein glycosyltransferase
VHVFLLQGVMVRLMLVLAPVMCILSGIGISSVLSTYMRNLDITQPKKNPSSASTTTTTTRARRTDDSSTYPRKNEIAFGVICMMTFFLMTYVFHCTWVTSEAYSSPSIVLSARSGDGSKYIFDDFREAYWWLRYNTDEVCPYCLLIFVD